MIWKKRGNVPRFRFSVYGTVFGKNMIFDAPFVVGGGDFVIA